MYTPVAKAEQSMPHFKDIIYQASPAMSADNLTTFGLRKKREPDTDR